jgi:hypothetical protein
MASHENSARYAIATKAKPPGRRATGRQMLSTFLERRRREVFASEVQ